MVTSTSTRFPKRTLLLCALLAGVALAVAACAPLTVLNLLVPTTTHEATRDLAYGEHPRQKLDVYRPLSASPAAGRGAPIVVFFYGGAWNSGARADYLFAAEAFASRGLLTVVPDYRLYPEVRYPDFLFDCGKAVAWVVRNAARFGGDPQRIYLAGHSAGAYNAAMLTYAPAYLAQQGVDAGAIRGFIGLAGPYDFLPLTGATTRAVFGFPDTAISTQPIHFVGAANGRRLAPALLLTTPDDSTVKPGNSARLAQALRAAGADAREISYPGLDHQRLVGALAAPLRRLAPLQDDITGFIDAHP